ncbi:hypothetical protein [Alkalihalobacterium elongatum]|uniref:hypothetical protein n=1 Tax=Alkalihalobacterium elongatum TaxID=2675466 RepID=UPI001C1FBE1D|nr:hypothetical protein [Alkalihalobacterium elongatum]
MYNIHFYEKRNLLLSQLLTSVPSVDGAVKIKGRKGKVMSVNSISENIYHVEITLENKNKKAAEQSNKKKR